MKSIKLIATALSYFCGIFSVFSQQYVSFSGSIKDSTNGQVIGGATIYSITKAVEIKANGYGFFSYQAEKNKPEIFVIFKEGYASKNLNILNSSDTLINIFLNYHLLQAVNVTADSLTNNSVLQKDSRGLLITSEKMDRIPLLLGEKDIIRSLQYLPGVQTVSEASCGIIVRGGSIDQNQFILDDVPVYNVNHLFGFVSAFNSDIVKEATFYKGDFPARYGGKLSSVTDVRSKDGNDKKFGGQFSINPISSKLMFEGPILKEKLTFCLSSRRSFVDYASPILFEEFSDYDLYHFYDINFKVKYTLNDKNRLYLSVYNGLDKFGSSGNAGDGEGVLKWGNTGGSLRWNRIISNKVFANTTVILSNYKFIYMLDDANASGSNAYSISYESNLQAFIAKTDIDWLPSNSLRFRSGVGFTKYKIEPGVTEHISDTSEYKINFSYQPIEVNIYAETKIDFSSRLHSTVGIRGDFFQNKFNYFSLQPRISLDFEATKNISLHTGYSRTYQPLHQLTNTSAGLPSELWVPALANLEPENADLFTLGSNFYLFHRLSFSIDGYYKKLNNIIDYKPGARFLAISQDPSKIEIPDWTQNVTQGNGESYGMEVLLEKSKGKFTGLLSYTLAWATQTFEEINFGETFYPSFDRRHNISIAMNYRFNRSPERKNIIELSSSWTYASANPVTLPSGYIENVEFTGQGIQEGYNYLTEYNNYVRLKAFHRLDLAIRLIRAKDTKRVWEFGVYNLYNQENPYSYSIHMTTNPSSRQTFININQKSYFGVLPYLSYAIKF